MNETTDKIILEDSPEAATYVTNIKGWVDVNGRFWGDGPFAESSARASSMTHRPCVDCTVLLARSSHPRCPTCSVRRVRARYEKLDKKSWYPEDGPITLFDDSEHYFFSYEDLDEYCERNDNCSYDALMPVLCERAHFRYADADMWEDVSGEDGDLIPVELMKALDEFNEKIEAVNNADKPSVWMPADIAAVLEKQSEE